MTLRVLAVDDERPALDELTYLLRAHPEVADVVSAHDASGALEALEGDPFDAVFVDVRMPGLSGLQLARLLSRFAEPPALVFVTAYDAHAVEAFELHALDYVLKPIRAERLAEAVRRVVTARQAESVAAAGDRQAAAYEDDDTVAVELGGSIRLVAAADVTYVEAQGDYARLHTDTGGHLVRVPLTALAERWEHRGFVRVHRSYLVNLRHLDELHFADGRYTVRIGTKTLPVSRRHSRELRDRLVRGAHPAPGTTQRS